MTGMKEGAGENPFADDPPTTTTDVEDDSDQTETEATTETSADTSGTTDTNTREPAQRQPMQIPYKLRRDGVQDGRDRVPLFLQPETKRAERDALRELEDRFGDDVSLTDLREGLVMAGLGHLDDVEEQLEEWGYGMTFES